MPCLPSPLPLLQLERDAARDQTRTAREAFNECRRAFDERRTAVNELRRQVCRLDLGLSDPKRGSGDREHLVLLDALPAPRGRRCLSNPACPPRPLCQADVAGEEVSKLRESFK